MNRSLYFGCEAKEWLLLIPIVMIALLAYSCSGQVGAADGKLQVFFTGNMRGNLTPCGCRISKGGVARLASFVERYHEPDANLLLVDAGNFVDRESAKKCSEKCRLMLASNELLGYAALNVGTQEIAMGRNALISLRDSAAFRTPLLSANLVNAGTGELIFEPYVIHEYSNMAVGIIGLISESAILSPAALDGGALRVNSAREAAARCVTELAGKVNSIVLIGELADNDITEIVRANPAIDLVITSGSRRLK